MDSIKKPIHTKDIFAAHLAAAYKFLHNYPSCLYSSWEHAGFPFLNPKRSPISPLEYLEMKK
jgi:hypothetical protein